MAATTDFKAWLNENLFECDYEDVCSLYNTVESETNNGLFTISRKGERLFVRRDSGEFLMISSEEARSLLLKLIEDNYCEGLGIEGYYSFHREMDKKD